MKLASIFFKASAVNLRFYQRYEQTSEKYEAASIFFKASAVNLRYYQRYEQTSEKYEACFNIFQSECSKSSI